ncbi:MAG: putative toxin-antitoxin system toxin component, PIN family, partial [Candidatus Berkelbacteria bacterium]|nr:putative toxin-antitoxin system toxin component, PIN family [Candidatus Berkelbacteria bacterium]
MVDDRLTVVIDTNILVSAIIFGGKPEEVLKQATSHRIRAVTSLVLLAELSGVLTKKFNYADRRVRAIEEKLKQGFEVVVPSREVKILNSADDRVLETALAGRCR